MAKKNLPKNTSPKSEAEILRVLFLNVVDVLIKKNKDGSLTPDSERSMSIFIGPDATSIAKIRRGERNPTLQQIMKLGNHFNLDFNYFFRKIPLRYELYNDVVVLKERKQELIQRMDERFRDEVNRFTNMILIFHAELLKHERESGISEMTKDSRRMLQDASDKINDAFAKN